MPSGRACDGRVRPGEDFKKPLSRDQSFFFPVHKTKDQKYAHAEAPEIQDNCEAALAARLMKNTVFLIISNVV